MALSKALQELIQGAKLDVNSVEEIARAAIAEDLGGSVDVTSSATIPEEQFAVAQFSNRKPGVVAGIPILCAVLEVCGISDYKIEHFDGEVVSANSLIISAHGKTQGILLAERSALN
ncbi:MAG: nicotinate-nucleotide diphosphorylase (carboxylating), partial [Actinobacteria bacterium]|nr:nicotinate-nucleotide diphosphorylase (carboxylating) [Actinomycetota bacterium]